MLTLRHVVSIVVGVAIIASAGVVYSQAYPNKSIRIVTTETGAGNDLLARIVAQGR
jgi:tripartite-type tricarboxylate transporter receptor subunit TctC